MKTGCAVLSLMYALISPVCSNAAETGFYVGLDAGQSRTEFDADRPIFTIGPPLPTNLSRDERDTAVALHVGYEFSNRIAVELTYADLGEASFTRTADLSAIPTATLTPGLPFPALLPGFSGVPVAGTAVGVYLAVPEREDLRIESKSLSLAVLASHPLGKTVAVFGRAGVAAQKMESSVGLWNGGQPVLVRGGDDEHSAGAAVLGVGVDWLFHSHWNLRAQAQRHFAFGDEEVYFVTIGDVTLFTAGIGFRF